MKLTFFATYHSLKYSYLVPPQPPALLKRLKITCIIGITVYIYILKPEKQMKHLKTSEEKEGQIRPTCFHLENIGLIQDGHKMVFG